MLDQTRHLLAGYIEINLNARPARRDGDVLQNFGKLRIVLAGLKLPE